MLDQVKRYISLYLFVCCASATLFAATGTGTVAHLTLEQALINLDQHTDYVKIFLVALCYVIGVGLCFSGVMKLKKYGTRTAFMSVETSLIGPLMQFFIGVALFYTPEFLQTINLTLYGSTTTSGGHFAQDLSFDTSASAYQSYIDPVLHLVQIIGLISFIRGWVQLSKVSGVGQSQPGMISKAITHIVSGSLAVNIYQVFDMLYYTISGAAS